MPAHGAVLCRFLDKSMVFMQHPHESQMDVMVRSLVSGKEVLGGHNV